MAGDMPCRCEGTFSCSDRPFCDRDLPPVDLSAAEPMDDPINAAAKAVARMVGGESEGWGLWRDWLSLSFDGPAGDMVLRRHPAPSEGRGAETGWLTMSDKQAKEDYRMVVRGVDVHGPRLYRWYAEATKQRAEVDRLRAALTVAEAERDTAKRDIVDWRDSYHKKSDALNGCAAALTAAESQRDEAVTLAGEAIERATYAATQIEDRLRQHMVGEHVKQLSARLAKLTKEGT